MNEHAGASCALSVLIVGVFAILLHEKDHPPQNLKSSTSSVANHGATQEVASVSPAPPTPTVKSNVESTSHPSPVLVTVPERPPVIETVSRRSPPLTRADPKPVAKGRRSPDRVVPRRPKSSYALVEPGETLTDLSVRVYGTTNLAESIYKANRDQISRPDITLSPGTLLRTP